MAQHRQTLQDLFRSEAWGDVLKWASSRAESCKNVLSRVNPTDAVAIAGLQAEIRILRMLGEDWFEQELTKEENVAPRT